MATSATQNLLPAVLDDLLRWCGSTEGEGAIVGVPSTDAWALALPATPLVAGDRVVMTRAGEDSARWAAMASSLGYDVVCIDVAAGEGPSLGELTHLLWWDASIKAVFVARDETSTGITADPGEVRRVMELTGSDALLLVDCSASWGREGMRQDAWSADLTITALGTPGEAPGSGALLTWSARLPGLDDVRDRAGEPARDVLGRIRSTLEDLAVEGGSGQTRGWLVEGLRRGLAAVGLEALAEQYPSDAVTVVRMPASARAMKLEHLTAAQGLTPTDLGVGALAGHVLRIWHSGLQDEVAVLSVVATAELALFFAGSPVTTGRGLQAARSWFDAPRADAA
jgi:aspartate aminotransferase-like enzyme